MDSLRRAASVGVAVALAPLVLAFGFGWWNTPATWLQELWLLTLDRSALLVELVPGEAFWMLLLGGSTLGGCTTWLARREGSAQRGAVVAEVVFAAVGLCGLLGIALVGVAIDRVTFWLGAGWLLWALRPGAPPRAAAPPALSRALALALGLASFLLAGRTLLEGPGMHSPALSLGSHWLDGPGRSALTSAGPWVLLGFVALFVERRLAGPAALAPLLGLAIVAAGASWLGAPPGPRELADAVSAFGVLLCVPALARFGEGAPPGPAFDPRTLLFRGLPLLLWAGVCGSRGLTVFLWTAPGALPGDVHLVNQRPGVFDLATTASGTIWYSDRDRNAIGRWGAPVDHEFRLRVAPEEVGVVGEEAWFSSAGRHGSFLQSAGEDAMGMPLPVPGCWVSSWQSIPSDFREASGSAPGSALMGCESSPILWEVDPEAYELRRALGVDLEVEDVAFGADGDLYGVSLWNGATLAALDWPSGQPLKERRIGSFNWAVEADGRGTIWVPRFFEGQLLGFGEGGLRLKRRIRLPFGVRAAVLDRDTQVFWASAAYAGELVAVHLPTGERRRWALCGQGRALTLARDGSVLLGSDCGVFRVRWRPGDFAS